MDSYEEKTALIIVTEDLNTCTSGNFRFTGNSAGHNIILFSFQWHRGQKRTHVACAGRRKLLQMSVRTECEFVTHKDGSDNVRSQPDQEALRIHAFNWRCEENIHIFRFSVTDVENIGGVIFSFNFHRDEKVILAIDTHHAASVISVEIFHIVHLFKLGSLEGIFFTHTGDLQCLDAVTAGWLHCLEF